MASVQQLGCEQLNIMLETVFFFILMRTEEKVMEHLSFEGAM
jgi:hypothetical protein